MDSNGEVDNTIDPLLQSEFKIEVVEEMSTSKKERLCGKPVEWHNCDKCGLKFPLETMLNRHKVAHNYSSGIKKMKKSVALSSKAEKSNKSKSDLEVSSPDLKYNCTVCDFTCDKRSIFVSHLKCEKHSHRNIPTAIKSKEKPSQIYFCKICNFESKKRTNLMSHVKRMHRQELKLQVNVDNEVECEDPEVDPMRNSKTQKKLIADCLKCDMCDFECTNKSTLYSHKRRHRTIDTGDVYQCDECNYKTAKKQSLYSHIHRKHKPFKSSGSKGEPEYFSCSQCDYKNKNKYELKVHVARKHTDDFKFSCDICGKKFKVKGDLTNHIRFSHREQPVICDVCGKTCLNSNSLYVHQKFAHYKAKYECQVCKRRMVSQENLDEHMLRQHEKRENVVCEECGKTFSRNSRLKIHMRIHTGDKPYDCTICNKSFARRTALKQHLLIHTGMRPYVCDICGKAFTQKPGLISHRKSHPGPLPPLPRVLIDHILNDVLRPPL